MSARYFIDNNTLSHMTVTDHATSIVNAQCLVPEEIRYEARGLPTAGLIDRLVYPISTSILAIVAEVVASLQPGDKLVDLYSNKGNGDALLIASALDAKRHSEQTLFPEEVCIASDDRGVRRTATRFGLSSISSAEFLALIRSG